LSLTSFRLAASGETIAAIGVGVKHQAIAFDHQLNARTILAVTAIDFCQMLPFVLLLGAMALGPVVAPHWWQRHYAKVALGLGVVTVSWYFFRTLTTKSF